MGPDLPLTTEHNSGLLATFLAGRVSNQPCQPKKQSFAILLNNVQSLVFDLYHLFTNSVSGFWD